MRTRAPPARRPPRPEFFRCTCLRFFCARGRGPTKVFRVFIFSSASTIPNNIERGLGGGRRRRRREKRIRSGKREKRGNRGLVPSCRWCYFGTTYKTRLLTVGSSRCPPASRLWTPPPASRHPPRSGNPRRESFRGGTPPRSGRRSGGSRPAGGNGVEEEKTKNLSPSPQSTMQARKEGREGLSRDRAFDFGRCVYVFVCVCVCVRARQLAALGTRLCTHAGVRIGSARVYWSRRIPYITQSLDRFSKLGISLRNENDFKIKPTTIRTALGEIFPNATPFWLLTLSAA